MTPGTSIIIPVFNAERYIETCIRSILSQTTDDYEVILVNDGSTDATMDVVNAMKLDSRFRLYHQPGNQGAAAARNIGLGVSKAEFVTFVDADDEVYCTFLESLLHAITRDDADISIGNKRVRSGRSEKYRTPLLKDDLITGENILKSGLLAHNAPHGKLFRRSFLASNDIRFHEGVTYEDYIFWIACLSCIPKLSAITEVVYLYKRNPGSISSKTKLLSDYNLKSRAVQTRECLRIAGESRLKGFHSLFFKVQFNGARILRHVNALIDTEVEGDRETRIALLRELVAEHEPLVVRYLTGWRRFLYVVLIRGTDEELYRFLDFLHHGKSLSARVLPSDGKRRLLVERKSFPSLSGVDDSLFDVSDLVGA